jgi:outer membrane protein OmpA-like peptidoglycan-associated protein
VIPRERCGLLLLAGALALATSHRAAADPMRWHLELGGAHPVGDPQGHEYGPGIEGRLAAELALGRRFGLQLEGGSLWVARTNPPSDPSFAPHGDGSAVFAMGGVRLRPMFDVAGPWIDVNAGYVRTGSLDRFGFDTHVGYDWRVGEGRWDVGPYLGYFQIVQPSDALRPQDAHVISIGIHVALGAKRTPPPTLVSQPPPEPPAVPASPPPDRDGDGIVDAQDACPDVAGVPSDDPSRNGCPVPTEDVRIVEDRIEYGETILFETNFSVIQPAAMPILRSLAKLVIANVQIEEVAITGHADERGSEEFNLRLSKARAEAVRAILVTFGVDRGRLTIQGLGYTRPRAQGHTEEDWRQNRRVEFRITKARAGLGAPATRPVVPQGAQP